MPTEPELPRVWGWLFAGFRWYTPRLLRKRFTAVRLANGSAPWPRDGRPVLVAMNHPSWWDPLIAVLLSSQFATDEQYAAMDADALNKHRVFQRLGFFGVDPHTLQGARDFLKLAAKLLDAPNRVVWVTGQGRFADPRERPLNLRSGVGHLAARMSDGVVLPVAFDYPFWDVAKPEALVRVGVPLETRDHPNTSGKAWTARIESALAETMDALAADAISRDAARFTTLLDRRTPLPRGGSVLRAMLGPRRGGGRR